MIYDMIYDIWYDMIWYDMIWYDMMGLSSICVTGLHTNKSSTDTITWKVSVVYDISHEVSFFIWYTHTVCEEWMY